MRRDMAEAQASLRGWGKTDRRDNWWVGPLVTFVVLSLFVVYATIRALVNDDFIVHDHDLISPFYSPNLREWGLLPSWLSPAIAILWAPAGFRLTCYYYRKAYYRAFTQHPPACAVSEGRHGKDYGGERRFPLILQNAHRYLLYFALVVLVFLWLDVIWAFSYDGFHVTVGGLVLLTTTLLLSFYTFSCHSFRHLIGGQMDSFSGGGLVQIRHKGWKTATRLNEKHMEYAWASLFGVMLADFYVWMVAAGHLKNYVIV
jgi:hypothetical protein